MLGFIAKIAPEKLREAKEQSGEITAAKLYEMLIEQWLDFEHARANPPGAPQGISRAKLRELVTEAGRRVLGSGTPKSLAIGELPREPAGRSARGIEPAVVEHMIGSGSLLVRDAEGRFSFVHRSVMEWLVAEAAAREVRESGDAAALGADEMSELMADFFVSLAGRERAERGRGDGAGARRRGARRRTRRRVLKRLEARRWRGEPSPGDDGSRRAGSRGQDFSGRRLAGGEPRAGGPARGDAGRGQDERRLAGRGAARAGGSGAGGAGGGGSRRGPIWRSRGCSAPICGAREGLAAAQLRGAKLVGAQGVEVEGLAAVGAAPPVPGEAEPMWAPASGCNAVAWSPSGDLVASGHDDGSVRLWDAVSGQAIRTMLWSFGAGPERRLQPRRQTLASGSDDKTVRLWDVATGTSLRAFEGHTNAVSERRLQPRRQHPRLRVR